MHGIHVRILNHTIYQGFVHLHGIAELEGHAQVEGIRRYLSGRKDGPQSLQRAGRDPGHDHALLLREICHDDPFATGKGGHGEPISFEGQGTEALESMGKVEELFDGVSPNGAELF